MKSGEFLFVEWRDVVLKAAAFRLEGGRPRALGFQAALLSERTADVAATSLKGLVKKLKSVSRRAYVILPRSQAVVRYLTFPSADPAQIRNLLATQISDFLPYDIHEIVYDFTVAHVEANGFARVILMSFTKPVLARYTQMMAAAGLAIEDFVFASQAQHFAAFSAMGKDARPEKQTAFVDIDVDASDLVLFRGDQLVYSRPMGIGAKSGAGAPAPFEARLAAELKLSVDALQKECEFARTEKILLVEEAQLSAEVFSAIEAKLAVKPTPLALAHLPVLMAPGAVESLRQILSQGFSLTALLGAPFIPETKRFVILPPDLGSKRRVAGEKREVALALAGLTAFLVTCIAAGAALYGLQASRLGALEERLDLLSQTAGPVEKMASRLGLLEASQKRKVSFLAMLAELHRVAPPGVTLTELGYEEGQPLRLRGLALRGGEVSDFVSALEGSSFFRDSKFDFQQRRQVEGRGYYDFQISTGFEGASPGEAS